MRAEDVAWEVLSASLNTDWSVSSLDSSSLNRRQKTTKPQPCWAWLNEAQALDVHATAVSLEGLVSVICGDSSECGFCCAPVPLWG